MALCSQTGRLPRGRPRREGGVEGAQGTAGRYKKH